MKPSRKQKIKQNIGGRRGRGRSDWLTDPMSRGEARRMAGANARTESAPVISQIKRDREGSRKREQQIGQQFGQLGANMGEAAAQTDASYSQANAAVLANIEAAQKAAQANQAQIAGGNADFAKLTGADPSAFAQGTQEAASAASQRSLAQAMLAAPIAQAGASQAGHLRNVGLNARREGIQQMGKERSRREEIKQDLTTARQARAQKGVSGFMDIRQGERDYGIQKAAFKLDKSTAAQDAAQAAADQRLEEAKFGETQRHNRATEANSRADNGDGGLTPTQRRAARREKTDATSAVKTLFSAYQEAGKPPQSKEEWANFIALAAKESGADYSVVKREVSKLRNSLKRKRQQEPYDPPGGWGG